MTIHKISIRAARLERDLTQDQAARYAAVCERTWRRYEAGDLEMPEWRYRLFMRRTEHILWNEDDSYGDMYGNTAYDAIAADRKRI